MVWAPVYVSATELAQYLRIDDAIDDVELGLAAAAASRAVDHTTRRQFGQVDTAEERRYTPVWNRRRRRWQVKIDDLMDETGLDVQVDAGAVDAYVLEPVNAVTEVMPHTRLTIEPDSSAQPAGLDGEVVVTAMWGWTAVPEAIRQATLLQASRLHARRFSPYGVAGSPETGSELRLLDRVDPDVAVALRRYIRDRVVVG